MANQGRDGSSFVDERNAGLEELNGKRVHEDPWGAREKRKGGSSLIRGRKGGADKSWKELGGNVTRRLGRRLRGT